MQSNELRSRVEVPTIYFNRIEPAQLQMTAFPTELSAWLKSQKTVDCRNLRPAAGETDGRPGYLQDRRDVVGMYRSRVKTLGVGNTVGHWPDNVLGLFSSTDMDIASNVRGKLLPVGSIDEKVNGGERFEEPGVFVELRKQNGETAWRVWRQELSEQIVEAGDGRRDYYRGRTDA